MIRSLCVFLLVYASVNTYAQPCDKFPADCPDNEMLQQAAEKKWEGPADLKVKEEYLMQDSLRHFTIRMMEDIAKKKNWRLYELLEDQESGIGIDDNTKPLPYLLRRPCHWGISFIFIVSEDSLQAWQNWYNTDLKRRSDEVVEGYKQTDNSSEQSFVDSATYYGNQKAKYMTDHLADYQKALLSSDPKSQKKYEDEMKKYDSKINAFINNANGKKDENFLGANSLQENLQEYKKRNTISYRNASLMRVSFNINDYTTPAFSETVKMEKPLPVPSAALAALFHNSQPDEFDRLSQFLRSPDFALLLFGKWITRLNQYNSYDAVYRSDKKANDAVSVKKIPPDKVQTISVFIEGSPGYINRFLQSFDPQKLNSLVVKE
jgi:hypothetical protein